MTAWFHSEPWWYWTLFAISTAVLLVVAREMWRITRESKRRLRLANDRRDRVMEDFYWRVHREEELALALRLRTHRLRRENPTPNGLIKAVV